MIYIKTAQEINKMREAGKLLASLYEEIKEKIKIGTTTMELNDFAESYMLSHNAIPSQIGYKGYPYAICASLNDEICHGFPRNTPLKDGDLLKIDTVLNLDGWLADSARTFIVGEGSIDAINLTQATEKAMYLGIEQAILGNRLGDIGHAIQSYVEALGYSVVRDFIGHGIGKNMHEDPQVEHIGKKGRGLRLSEGMVFTIEPMINIGDYRLTIDKDGWTARTLDGSLSAQFEHTIAITKDGPKILTKLED